MAAKFRIGDVVQITPDDEGLRQDMTVYVPIVAIVSTDQEFEYYVHAHPELRPCLPGGEEIADASFDFSESRTGPGFRLFGGWKVKVEKVN